MPIRTRQSTLEHAAFVSRTHLSRAQTDQQENGKNAWLVVDASAVGAGAGGTCVGSGLCVVLLRKRRWSASLRARRLRARRRTQLVVRTASPRASQLLLLDLCGVCWHRCCSRCDAPLAESHEIRRAAGGKAATRKASARRSLTTQQCPAWRQSACTARSTAIIATRCLPSESSCFVVVVVDSFWNFKFFVVVVVVVPFIIVCF